MTKAKPEKIWTPEGFDDFRMLFPQTGPMDPNLDRSWSARFIRAWHMGRTALDDSLRPSASDTTVIFVRGFLGHYMPGNLRAPCAALRRLGIDAFLAANHPGATVSLNVAALARQLDRRPMRGKLLFCGHSRGGLESLTLLAGNDALANRCMGVALSQTAHGPSYVMESILKGRHRNAPFPIRRRAAETMQRAGLLLARALQGGLEQTSEFWPCLVDAVEREHRPFPVLQTASWSTHPTAWLDSFHGRLGEIGPGRAHDGQFFLEDLVWPGLPHILLPRLDHAQPAMGGYGFDHVRYWLAIISLFLERSHP